MTETVPSGSMTGGYMCSNCGMFVGWGWTHQCSFPQMPPTPSPSAPLCHAQVFALTRDDIRKIVREELERALKGATDAEEGDNG